MVEALNAVVELRKGVGPLAQAAIATFWRKNQEGFPGHG
jgi:hypothetical protein